MVPDRRFKYGILLHPETPNVQETLQCLTDELVGSYRDPLNPHLGSLEVKSSFVIESVEGRVHFRVDHGPEWQVFRDDLEGEVREGLLACLDWWNGETHLIAPLGKELEWDGPSLPNASTRVWQGLSVQNITQYPKRLGHRVLEEWNPGLLFFPFQYIYHSPTREEELHAMQEWGKTSEAELKAALAALTYPVGQSWFFTVARSYRSAIMPDPQRMRHVGTRQQAEEAAEDYRGLCFLVDAKTGEYTSRWAER